MYRAKNGAGLVSGRWTPRRRTYAAMTGDQMRLVILALCQKEPQPTWKLGNATGSVSNSVAPKARLVIQDLVESGYLKSYVHQSTVYRTRYYQTTPAGVDFLASLDPIKIVPEIKPRNSRCRCGTFKKFDVSVCKKCTRRLEEMARNIVAEFEAQNG